MNRREDLRWLEGLMDLALVEIGEVLILKQVLV